ncbi:MAG: hypothetical protein EXS10_02910 [Phycisphaerales bacterium]|nr:hypothetical protein [Phycisphaerales bacterium]
MSSARSRWTITLLTTCLVLSSGAAFVHAQDTDAQSLFDEAMGVAVKGSRSDAQVLFAKSADAFEAGARVDESAGLWFNAGNARLQAGETGRAIAAFLRAQALAPADTSIAANLDEARRSRESLTAAIEPTGLARVAPHWRFIDASTRALLALTGWTILWSGVCALLLLDAAKERARGLWKVAAATGALFGCVAGATVLGDRLARSGDQRAVVIAQEILPRKGNGESFAPAIEASLHAGTECVILATRPDWTEISLAPDVRGWVPSNALERLW